MEVDITLAWPPSVNRIWKYGKGRVRSDKSVIEYYKNMMLLYRGKIKRTLKGRIRVHMNVYPPDNKVRDLDNILKVPMDAMQKMTVYKNDSQIDELHIYRKEVSKRNARLVVHLEEIEDAV
jgi:crossover junction endodeoxyribonuclease RusA